MITSALLHGSRHLQPWAGAWQQWAAAANVVGAGFHGWSLHSSCSCSSSSSSGTAVPPADRQHHHQQQPRLSAPAFSAQPTTSGWAVLPSRCYHHDSNPYSSSSSYYASSSSSSYGYGPPAEVHATTILSVRKGGEVVVMGDGQATANDFIVKPNVVKVRRIGPQAIGGFAGRAADGLALLERLETKLEEHPGQLQRAAVELAKMWRSDRMLRDLDASLIVADCSLTLWLMGNGDVLEAPDGVMAIGSGSDFAEAAARALLDLPHTNAMGIASKAMRIAADSCVYTNHNLRWHHIAADGTITSGASSPPPLPPPPTAAAASEAAAGAGSESVPQQQQQQQQGQVGVAEAEEESSSSGPNNKKAPGQKTGSGSGSKRKQQQQQEVEDGGSSSDEDSRGRQ